MKTLVIYYSYAGSTRAYAENLAKEREADIVEVKDQKRPGLVGTFLRCPKALGQKPGKVQPFQADFNAYDRIVVLGPIWASYPAPPVNNIFERLPAGKEVELVLLSGGSGTAESKEKIIAKAQATGAKVVDYKDVSTGKGPNGKGLPAS